jgi:predicted RNA-binding Zn ribbon-like protein
LAAKTAYERTKGKPYAETFRCPGGALCLDFCNSQPVAWMAHHENPGQEVQADGAEEWIASFADLIDWLDAAEAIDAKQAARLRAAGARAPDSAQELWKRALELREAMVRVFLARTVGRRAETTDLQIIDEEYARTAPFARLSATGDGFSWRLDPSAEGFEALLQPIVASAVGLLTSAKLARLRRCGNSTCYWLFLDETKNCSRRWCEMASCGNRMKVRRHRERQRAT